MENEKLPDLNQIQPLESIFLECLISNGRTPPVGPNSIASFSQPNVRLYPMVNYEQQKVGFDIRIQTATFDKENKSLSVEASFRLYISFRVANLSELLYYEEKFGQEIPTPLLTTSLIGVAYSTARGMIVSKVADTVMSGFSLPLRSARQLMEEAQPSLDEVQTIRASIPAPVAKPENFAQTKEQTSIRW